MANRERSDSINSFTNSALIKRLVLGENAEKAFVYGAFGQLSAEYSVGRPAPPCSTCYIARIIWVRHGWFPTRTPTSLARHDYPPLGEEIAANVGGRDGTFGTSDLVRAMAKSKDGCMVAQALICCGLACCLFSSIC